MPPTEFNPKGYWENLSFAKLNDAILARLGGTWDEPPTFPEGWELSPELADLKEYAREFIEAEFDKARAWGWKDPRTCLTLPFWQQILPPIKYVIFLRNPLDVAQSLHVRDGFAFEKGINLWLIHLRGALVHTVGQPRIFVLYEQLLRDTAPQIQRLSGFVTGSDAELEEKLRTAIGKSVDIGLCHYATSLLDLVNDPRLPYAIKAIYTILRLYAGHDSRFSGVDNEAAAALHALNQLVEDAFKDGNQWPTFADDEVRSGNRLSGTSSTLEQSTNMPEAREADFIRLRTEPKAEEMMKPTANRNNSEIESLTEKVRSLTIALNTQTLLLVQTDRKTARMETERDELAEESRKLGHTVQAQRELLAHAAAENFSFLGRIDNLIEQMSTLQATVHKQSELTQAIETSLAWRTVLRYRRLRDRFFPDGTSRRRLYEIAKNRVKLLWRPLEGEPVGNQRIVRNSFTTPLLSKPKVSVIVPNYNHARYLCRRLESVVCQQFQDSEIIILDDGSTDSSRKILQRYEYQSRCRLFFNEANGGSVTAQWQKGLNEARGEFVWFAESDDYASPHFLERLVPILDQNPSLGMVYCQSYLVDLENQIQGDASGWTDDLDPHRWRNDFTNKGRDEIERFLSKKNTIPNASAVLIRASVLREMGTLISPYHLCGDWELWIKVLLRSDIAFVAEKLNYWRQRSSNVRAAPAGVLEFQEGSRIIKFLSDELGSSETETNQRLSEFSHRCRQWLEASKLE